MYVEKENFQKVYTNKQLKDNLDSFANIDQEKQIQFTGCEFKNGEIVLAEA